MAKPLVFLPEVPAEIEATRDWYADRSLDVAQRFLASLEQVLLLIQSRPLQGAYHDDRRLYRYQRVADFPFMVVYREYDDHILIVACYHPSRHPDYWKERLG
jgi:plasmid stabilization system protein ParE